MKSNEPKLRIGDAVRFRHINRNITSWIPVYSRGTVIAVSPKQEQVCVMRGFGEFRWSKWFPRSVVEKL